MNKATVTQTITFNCGHTFTYALPMGQLSLPLAHGADVTCVDCWNTSGYEGFRLVVAVANSDERAELVAETERTDGALFGLALSEVPALDGGLFSVVAA
ncbi:hypothetical protein [Actinomadura rubrisoli]|uniref:Uncharacterized protein n=1 Tax=Actinomadura rubrisoli TaxID=2530368 RepID=A0A4R5BUK7_9ACTN|nr:hypothetical protein [Actinomadura rubrisoli]TDD90781.1 hypothetical protein E1298_12840 [Actinomadura rubrisoli]